MNICDFFDIVNQKRLLNILREKINDEPILILIQQMFNANVLFYKIGGEKNFYGNPLSLFLVNLYFHKLDEFVVKRCIEDWNKNSRVLLLKNGDVLLMFQ